MWNMGISTAKYIVVGTSVYQFVKYLRNGIFQEGAANTLFGGAH